MIYTFNLIYIKNSCKAKRKQKTIHFLVLIERGNYCEFLTDNKSFNFEENIDN